MIPHLELDEHDVRRLLSTLRSAHTAFEDPRIRVIAIPMRPEQIRNYTPPPEHHSFWDRFRRRDRVQYIPLAEVTYDR